MGERDRDRYRGVVAAAASPGWLRKARPSCCGRYLCCCVAEVLGARGGKIRRGVKASVLVAGADETARCAQCNSRHCMGKSL